MSTLAEAIDRTTQSSTGGGIGDPDNSVRQNVNILPR